MYVRKMGWEKRLYLYLRAHRDDVFSWGKADCCTFSAGAIEALTGTNPMTVAGVSYQDASTSLAALGSATIREGVEKFIADMGLTECPPALAKRGDLVWMDHNETEFTLGIIGFSGRPISLSAAGIREARRRAVTRAWAIPCQ